MLLLGVCGVGGVMRELDLIALAFLAGQAFTWIAGYLGHFIQTYIQ